MVEGIRKCIIELKNLDFIYGCIHSRRMDLLPSRNGNNIFEL